MSKPTTYGPYLAITSGGYKHWCPACKTHHTFYVTPAPNRPVWKFNDNPYRPSFHPSLRATVEYTEALSGNKRPASTCHYILRDGRIQYLADCTHDLRGQTIQLPHLKALPGAYTS